MKRNNWSSADKGKLHWQMQIAMTTGFVRRQYSLSINIRFRNKHNGVWQAEERLKSVHKWPSFAPTSIPNHSHKGTASALAFSLKLMGKEKSYNCWWSWDHCHFSSPFCLCTLSFTWHLLCPLGKAIFWQGWWWCSFCTKEEILKCSHPLFWV